MANIKEAIIRAKLEGVLYEIMVKTNCDNVVFNKEGAEVTLTSYLAEILTTLAEKDSTADREAAITALKQEMLGDTPVEAYNTFTELAAYIEEHGEAAEALTEAIGKKASAADLTAAIERIAALETKKVAEGDLETTLAEKINTAATKAANADAKAHEHGNKDVLDGITAEQVAAWGKRKVYIQAEQPADLADGDLWLQILQ